MANDQQKAVDKAKIQALMEGSLSQAESLACLRQLATTAALTELNQATFKITIDTVLRTALPDSAQHFVRSGDRLIDCCGTGGSGLGHYNTSTTVAFVLAAAGLKVAKFGNRAASSRSGSFDLLDKLGIGGTRTLPALGDILEKTNLAFLFAPQFYPALAKLAPLRKEVGQPTVFNYIGPLLNPTAPVYRLIGVPNRQVQDLIAAHLLTAGQVEHALVVSAQSGLDELDVHSPNTIARIQRKLERDNGASHVMDIETAPITSPSKFHGKQEESLSVDDNVAIFKALLSGQLDGDNYYYALVCLNAAAALGAAGLVTNIAEGRQVAAQLLKEGAVQAKFLQYQDQFK